jgi:hypothetical protein
LKQIQSFAKKVEGVRMLHLKSSSDAVPLDSLAELAITTAVRLQQEKLTNIRDVFKAADLDGNGHLDLNEFKILYKLITENKAPLTKLFDQYCT